MAIRCQCPQCGATNNAPDTAAGKKIKCGKCSTVIFVAAPTPISAPIPVGELLPDDPPDLPPPPPANFVPLPPAPDFPAVNFSTGPSSPRPTSTTSTAKRSSKKSNSALPLILAGVGGLLAIVMAVGGYVAMNSSPGSPKKPGDLAQTEKGSSKTKATTGTLVLDWPEAERAGGRLVVDNERKTFPTTGPVEFKLKPGSHSITIQRRGFEPANIDVTNVAGEEARERPQWKELPQVAFNPPAGNSGIEPQPFTPPATAQPPADDPPAGPQPANPNPTPRPTPNPAAGAAPKPYSIDRGDIPLSQPALTVSAEELTSGFADNEAAALSVYGNDAIVGVDGVVESPFVPLQSEFGGGWIRLRGAGKMIVYCHIVQPWAEYAKSLRVGHMIRLVGTKVGFHPDDKRVVTVQFCEFVSDDHRKAGAALPAAKPEFAQDDLQELSIYRGKKPELKTTAAEITELFATKAGVAQETYGDDKLFEITGVISAINLPADENKYPSLTLKGHGVWQAELRFQHQWRDMLAQKKVGETVRLVASFARKDFEKENLVWIDGAEFVLE